jgi:hypothetical protein
MVPKWSRKCGVACTSPLTGERTPQRTAMREGLLGGTLRALAHDVPQVPLPDALAIVLLLARREPRNYPRAGARFIGRLALERPLELVDIRDATSALLALPHAGTAELRVVCERWGVDWRPPRRLPPGPGTPRLG